MAKEGEDTIDIYQERYLAHVDRKKELIAQATHDAPVRRPKRSPDHLALTDAIGGRRSQRIFNDLRLSERELDCLYEAVRLAPSSCNRQAILIKVINDTIDQYQLSSLLVGGRDWLFRATTIILLFADMRAYKSPVEKDFMPWLDAGFVAENMYLMAEALDVGACFVNPNIRPKDREQFKVLFNPRGLRFCGAMALGNYYEKAPESPKRTTEEIFYDEGV